MPQQIIFRKAILETLSPSHTCSSLQLLLDGPRSEQRITGPAESATVRSLVQVPQYRRVSLEEFHRPIDSRIATNVQAPFTATGKKPGDLDLLIAHPTLPHEAIAIECKRVKITVESAGNDHLNKIEEVATGVKQANALREFGFYQTYLCVIAVVDAATQQHMNVLNRGIDSEATCNYSEERTFSRLISSSAIEPWSHKVPLSFVLADTRDRWV